VFCTEICETHKIKRNFSSHLPGKGAPGLLFLAVLCYNKVFTANGHEFPMGEFCIYSAKALCFSANTPGKEG
jgi:hypothetical protein